MTPTHEQEYIISLSELKRANVFMFTNKLKELSARPLSSAIQQEMEKVLSFLDELISDRVSDARKREIVESLRTQQEQP